MKNLRQEVISKVLSKELVECIEVSYIDAEIKNGKIWWKDNELTIDTQIDDISRFVGKVKTLFKKYETFDFLNTKKLPKEWDKLSDLRTKEANKLKELTLKKVEELAKELKAHGKWSLVNIGWVDYEDHEQGDERLMMKWDNKKGIQLINQEYSYDDGWDDRGSIFKKYEADNFDSVKEKITAKQYRTLAKKLPGRIKELTDGFIDDVAELQNLVEQMKNLEVHNA